MKVIVVMGVSGCGKSTLCKRVLEHLQSSPEWSLRAEFIEADDFHSASNKRKMSLGEGISDDERNSWFSAVIESVRRHIAAGASDVILLACSALRREHRNELRRLASSQNAFALSLHFVYLQMDRPAVERQLSTRSDHFAANAQLLASQFSVLQEPTESTELADVTVVSASLLASRVNSVLKVLAKTE